MKTKTLKTVNKFFILLIFLTIIACNQGNKIQSELYFGLSNSMGPITEEEWNKYETGVLQNVFDGYSIIDCSGFWISGTGEKVVEESKKVVLIHSNNATESRKIDSVIQIYKVDFDQESVMLVQKSADVSFK